MAKKNKSKKSSKKNSDLITSNAQPIAVAAPAAFQGTYTPGTYVSEYGDQLTGALDKVTNWSYDPMQDASYQALAKVYNARGNLAAKNSLADAAALNGGYGSSYAVSAAQQARNQYNQELAALIPDFENAAYNRATGTLNALRDADDTAYGRFRDTESDKQWKYSMDYDQYRDQVADYQWGTNYNYQLGRDQVADKQWAKEYALSKKNSSGGGGGGRSGGRSGSGYSGGSSGGTSAYDAAWIKAQAEANPNIAAAQQKGKSMTDYYKNQKKRLGNGGR